MSTALTPAIPPLGISDWNRLTKGNKLVVDKTGKLWDLVSDYDKVCISRPRRMGKTTLCSMLYELFAHGKDSFAGTAVYDLWAEQTYPVISLSFLNSNGKDDVSLFEATLKDAVVNAFSQAGFPEVEQFDRRDVFSGFLGKFNKIAQKHTLVFLIDEWDRPLSSCLDNEDTFNRVKKVLSVFYSWLRNVPNLRFVFITGIMRYREVSLFSGQDIQDLSMDPEYADLLGYTQAEVEHYFAGYIDTAATQLQLTRKELLQQLAQHYDGFCFDEDAAVKVYCPYSINKFFFQVYKGKKPRFDNYWMVSANASTALVAYLRGHDLDVDTIRQICQQPLNLSYQEINDASFFGTVSFQQLLVQAGYFSLKDIDAESKDEPDNIEDRSYICGVTNHEVSREFFPVFNKFLAGFEQKRVRELATANKKAQQNLLAGNIAQMCTGLNMVLCNIGYEILKDAKEVLYGYFFEQALVSKKIATERETRNNSGRCDLVATTKDRVYVFELKRCRLKGNTDAAKRDMLERGDKQILNRFYGNNFLAKGKPVTGVVLVVCDKYRQICAWRTIEHTAQGIKRQEGMVPPLSIATQDLVKPKVSSTSMAAQAASATKDAKKQSAAKQRNAKKTKTQP